jgi:hypothetical protein
MTLIARILKSFIPQAPSAPSATTFSVRRAGLETHVSLSKGLSCPETSGFQELDLLQEKLSQLPGAINEGLNKRDFAIIKKY